MRKLTHEEISLKRLKADEARIATRLPIYGLMDNIRSLYNVGSMFRTADGAMLEKLYLCGHTPHPPRKEIDKTALGATGTVPWEYVKDPLEAVTALRSAGIRICVLEQTTKSLPYYDIRKTDFPICLVVGNEIAGISPELVAAADMAIEIPMCGSKQSLNVAVAFGIALYDLVRVYKS